MNKIGYVVMETGWEYDDSCYDMHEGAGKPKKIHLDRDGAMKEVKELNVKRAREGDIRSYAEYYTSNEKLSEVSDRKLYASLGFDNIFDMKDSWCWEFEKDATDDDIIDMLNIFGISFYELVEVEIDDGV